jgi:hypothetical protein
MLRCAHMGMKIYDSRYGIRKEMFKAYMGNHF